MGPFVVVCQWAHAPAARPPRKARPCPPDYTRVLNVTGGHPQCKRDARVTGDTPNVTCDRGGFPSKCATCDIRSVPLSHARRAAAKAAKKRQAAKRTFACDIRSVPLSHFRKRTFACDIRSVPLSHFSSPRSGTGRRAGRRRSGGGGRRTTRARRGSSGCSRRATAPRAAAREDAALTGDTPNANGMRV